MDLKWPRKISLARIATALVVLLIVSLVGILGYRWRTYGHLAEEYESDAIMFKDMFIAPRPGEFRLPDGHLVIFTGRERAKAMFLEQYFKGLGEKYRHAASEPWKHLEPDRLLTIDDVPGTVSAGQPSVKNR